MAIKKVRLRDVEKGKRLEHFFTYYKVQTFYCILFAFLIGYSLYGFLKPRADVQVMWLSGSFTMECEQELRDNCEKLDWDTNGDGIVAMMLTHVDFYCDYEDLSSATTQELVYLVAAQDFSFFLVNDFAIDWMQKNEILGTYRDAGITGPGEDQPLLIPVTQIRELTGEHDEPLEDLYLCITPTPENDEKRLSEYLKQTEALRRLLNNNGIHQPPA